MADIIIPPNIPPSSVEWKLIDATAGYRSPFTGVVRTVDRAGHRWGVTMSWKYLNAADRHAMIAFIGQLRGKANRVRLFDQTTVQRGSMSAPELLTNNTFASGTTGWLAQISTLTASNGVLRARATRASASAPGAYQNPAATINVPYCGRSVILQRSPGFTTSGIYLGDATASLTNYTTALDYKTLTYTPSASPLTFYPGVGAAGNWTTDDFIDIGWSSLARCALLDGGGNLLQQSDTLGTTWTLNNVTIASNSGTAPDGTTTADGIQETAVTGGHYISQGATVTSAAQDISFSFAIKAGTRGFAALQLTEATGGSTASAYINLSTGAVTNVSGVTNWTNVRAVSSNLGSGWWYFCITARKTNAATSISGQLFAATAAGTSNYAGTAGSDAILGWRGTLAVSSHPTRLTSSVAAVVSPSSQSGTVLYLKGLPVSTNGLLQAGDRVEVGGQMVMATAPLDSDAAGMGILYCFPPLRTASASDTPVVFNTPTMRAVLAQDDPMWATTGGLFSDLTLQFEEAL